MKKQAFNPYLPSWEYLPDGEPHVFGNRVYVYGSHDRFNAPVFCVNDYVCWSAPMDDLSDWRYEGIIFRKNQDSKNKLGLRLLFAPDVCQGPDGRYYLYYAFDFMGVMGVAVCDTPAGQYEFLGHVHYPDGTVWGRRKGDQFPFDPGVLADDDGRVWLYSGFYTPMPAIVTGFQKLKNDGGTVVELERDMVTIKGEPKVIFPKAGPGSFPNHEFFEASSIRKDGDKYIFVYSSRHNHELCYAVSDRPDGGFRQAEVTSCGLNGGPLKGEGRYEARIACNLWSKDGVGRYDGPNPQKRLAAHPYFTQTGKDREDTPDQYIANMQDGAVAGFKYFDCKGIQAVSVELSGTAAGEFLLSAVPDFSIAAACLPVKLTGERRTLEAPCVLADGVRALYFKFQGIGHVDFHFFSLKGDAE